MRCDKSFIPFFLFPILVTSSVAEKVCVPDVPFRQEYREFHTAGLAGKSLDVRAIAIDRRNDRPIIATAAGVYELGRYGRWSRLVPDELDGPAYAVEVDSAGTLWVGTWNGLYRVDSSNKVEKVESVEPPVSCLFFDESQAWAAGPRGLWKRNEETWIEQEINLPHSPRSVLAASDGTVWIASDRGLFHIRDENLLHWFRTGEEILSSEVSSVAQDNQGFVWAGSSGGIDIFTGNGERVRSLTPEQGLPFSHVTSLAVHPEGTVWIGTPGGAVRYRDQEWSLRHSRRWLPNDRVRDIAFDENGFAWIATAGGVSVIRFKMMTLAEKAEYFHRIVLERKVRDPWLVGNTRLLTPGDVSTSIHEDDDNDGEYTNHYLAMEAFRYRVTGDSKAKQYAQKAFDAMEFLQTVTGTSGFVARSVVPVSWIDDPNDPNPYRPHDPNRTYTDREKMDELVKDPRFKPVEERWRLSADQKLYWKGDTSSDEITGHYFGYFYYNLLVAETEKEKRQVRELVRRVTDYLIQGGYTLKDIDGTHTRWGVWSPEKLFGDYDWSAETPINCTELLSYLKTASVITGDEKYDRLYRELAEEKGYLEMARAPMPNDPALWTHIDASLLTLTLHALLLAEEDPGYLEVYREGVRQWYREVAAEHCPLYGFTAGALAEVDFDVEACVDFLRDAPLDLVEWTVDNSHREDVRIVRRPELDRLQTDRLLPASERGIMRWDKNPWTAVKGNGGQIESSGIYWLLPYWMGRYYGFIGPAQ